MLEILQSETQSLEARSDLERRGLSCMHLSLRPKRKRFRHWLRRKERALIGDARKSWDIHRTVGFLSEQFPRNARILDQGAYNSEILPILHRVGFRNLTGVDMNPDVKRMPCARAIDWCIGDFLRTPFPDGSFDAITSISAIEHGFDADRLLAEVSRLLVPGGCFIASFDYWPEKISTEGMLLFDMTWRIFSREEVKDLLNRAERLFLRPEGRLCFEAGPSPAIHFSDRCYTFAWLVLRRSGARTCV